MKPNSQNYINHIALVLDGSTSMGRHRRTLIQVADNQIAHLARRSTELEQETRVSVYVFANTVQCVIFDKDVLRLPSIAAHYDTHGMTALIDATLKSQDDLAATAQLYGDHAFLTYVLTDGEENHSRRQPDELARRLAGLPDNWTVACFVPDQTGKHEAKKFGFPADNIAVWDTTSERGMAEVGEVIRQVTDTYMTSRATGVRGTKNLFTMGDVKVLNPQAVRASLQRLADDKFTLLDVRTGGYVREWVLAQGHQFELGGAYYQLMKPETVQGSKLIAVREKSTGAVYSGPDARNLLGLPAHDVRVQPGDNPLYEVFVQSTSTNRKLIPGTKLLLLR